MLDSYEKMLRQTNLAENTIVSYCHSLKQFIELYDGIFSKKNLLSFKGYLIERYSPKTVNLRILAIPCRDHYGSNMGVAFKGALFN